MRKFIAGFLIIMVLAVYVKSTFAETTKNITIATPVGPASGMLYVANDKGFIKDLKTSIVSFSSGRLALDALLAGKAQVALVAEAPLSLAAFQNYKFYIVSTIAESPLKLAILKSANIKTPQDIKGKKVSALFGTAGDYWMYSYLKSIGLSKSDVQAINLQPADMVNALVRKDIDAFFSWEPFPFQAQRELKDTVELISSKGIYLQTFNIVVMQDFAKSNGEFIKKFLSGLTKAEDFILKNKEESVMIVAKNSGMDVDVLKGIWDDHRYGVFLDKSLLGFLKNEGEWAILTGVVQTGSELPDYKSFIYEGFLKEIKESSANMK